MHPDGLLRLQISDSWHGFAAECRCFD